MRTGTEPPIWPPILAANPLPRYIEKLALTDGAGPRDLGKARALLTDDSALRSEVSGLLADLRRHKERLMAGVVCFHAVCRHRGVIIATHGLGWIVSSGWRHL
jgi:hypothetical protein